MMPLNPFKFAFYSEKVAFHLIIIEHTSSITQLSSDSINLLVWFLFQIKEGDVLYVAGGLMVEHPLTSPFVEAMVSFSNLSYPQNLKI